MACHFLAKASNHQHPNLRASFPAVAVEEGHTGVEMLTGPNSPGGQAGGWRAAAVANQQHLQWALYEEGIEPSAVLPAPRPPFVCYQRPSWSILTAIQGTVSRSTRWPTYAELLLQQDNSGQKTEPAAGKATVTCGRIPF